MADDKKEVVVNKDHGSGDNTPASGETVEIKPTDGNTVEIKPTETKPTDTKIEQLQKIINSENQNIKDLESSWYGNKDSRVLTSALLGAGLGGLGGLIMAPTDPNKSAKSRFKTRLKYALLGAGLGGVSAGSLMYGLGGFIDDHIKSKKDAVVEKENLIKERKELSEGKVNDKNKSLSSSVVKGLKLLPEYINGVNTEQFLNNMPAWWYVPGGAVYGAGVGGTTSLVTSLVGDALKSKTGKQIDINKLYANSNVPEKHRILPSKWDRIVAGTKKGGKWGGIFGSILTLLDGGQYVYEHLKK